LALFLLSSFFSSELLDTYSDDSDTLSFHRGGECPNKSLDTLKVRGRLAVKPVIPKTKHSKIEILIKFFEKSQFTTSQPLQLAPRKTTRTTRRKLISFPSVRYPKLPRAPPPQSSLLSRRLAAVLGSQRPSSYTNAKKLERIFRVCPVTRSSAFRAGYVMRIAGWTLLTLPSQDSDPIKQLGLWPSLLGGFDNIEGRM
jgi:hypothetical protein